MPPLPPYGMKVWPDGTPAAVEERKSKRRPLVVGRSRRLKSETPEVLGKSFLRGYAPAAKRPRLPPEYREESQQQIVQFVRPCGLQSRARFVFDRDPGGSKAAEEQVSKAALQFAALRARIRAKEAAGARVMHPPCAGAEGGCGDRP